MRFEEMSGRAVDQRKSVVSPVWLNTDSTGGARAFIDSQLDMRMARLDVDPT
jgi:hypothetical protein